MNINSLRIFLITGFIMLISILFILDIQEVFEPPFLLGILNTFFLSLIPFHVSFALTRTFANTGYITLVILSCGLAVLGIGGLTSGWLVGHEEAPNNIVTIYNTGALLCGMLHIAAFSISNIHLEIHSIKKRQIFLIAAYILIIIVSMVFFYLLFKDLTPAYIVQGLGPTLFGRVILAMTIASFFVSAVLASKKYSKTGLKLMAYYSTGLALFSIGLFGVFLQKFVGSPIGWAGRSAQYAGAVCMFIGVLDIRRIKELWPLSFEATIEAVIKEANADYKALIEASSDGIIAVDQKGRILIWNRGAEQIFGFTEKEAVGKRFKTLIQLNNQEEVLQTKSKISKFKSMQNTTQLTIQTEAMTKEEKLLSIEMSISESKKNSGSFDFYIIKDITELKKARAELSRLERMEYVAIIAAGIAHEIRNPMTTVLGYLQFLSDKPEFLSRKETFEVMMEELDKANSIISDFLILADLAPGEAKVMNLNDLLNKLHPLIETEAYPQDKQVRLLTSPLPDLKIVEKEITQLVLNLAKNGLEAMNDGGCLTIETYIEDMDVVLKIMDSGCGIPQDNVNKIGTPFFTTKDYGVGLGLAVSYKIIQTHHAKIDIDSCTDGTTVYVRFPLPNRSFD